MSNAYQHDYQYVVLRLVPRVEREEFINVGVVLYSQEADFLQAAFALDEARPGPRPGRGPGGGAGRPGPGMPRRRR